MNTLPRRRARHSGIERDVTEMLIEGRSGFMVKIIRPQNSPYQWTTDLQPLGDIANIEHLVPRDWFTMPFSQSTNRVIVPIVRTDSTAFYRMAWP